uniref:Uncharacterized protein n=2 Tax=Caenorhabditis elegans TaxID=6239 RepID=Q9XWY2_CAEEL|eukprot:NP_507786.2 Uncharacterized protein CELE_Y43F8B.13 [Caenorhabditis elegans]
MAYSLCHISSLHQHLYTEKPTQKMEEPYHELYDVDVFLAKAKEMSELNPPDVVLFSECIWGAATVCIKTFFLENFGTLINSHRSIEKFMDVVYSVVPPNLSVRQNLMNAFKHAELCHENFYKLLYVDNDWRTKYTNSVLTLQTFFNEVNANGTMENLKKWYKGGTLPGCEKFAALAWNLSVESTVAYGRINVTYKHVSY